MMSDKVYSIRDMEVISGVRAHTIRMWERRYSLLKPWRTDTNIRYYDDRDLRRLMNIAFLVARNYKISRIAQLEDDHLRKLVLAQEEQSPDDEAYIGRLVMYMLHFESRQFSHLLDEVIVRFGFDEAVFRVVFPFLRKVGIFWQVGSVYPAQEHFISSLIRHRFICELEKWQKEAAGELTILFFLHENEMHDLLLLFYAVMAARRGFRILYLGQNVPLQDLGQMATITPIDYVMTVFTNAIEDSQLASLVSGMALQLPGKRFIVTGARLKQHQLTLPEGFTVIGDNKDLSRLFDTL